VEKLLGRQEFNIGSKLDMKHILILNLFSVLPY
jgi:hypothetical protein